MHLVAINWTSPVCVHRGTQSDTWFPWFPFVSLILLWLCCHEPARRWVAAWWELLEKEDSENIIMCVTAKQQLAVWMEASDLNASPATLHNPRSSFRFKNSSNCGNFRWMYFKRSGIVTFVVFSLFFGRLVCVRLLLLIVTYFLRLVLIWSYGASIPLTPSILFHCFFKSLNNFFPSTSKEGASFVMVNESYVLDGRRAQFTASLVFSSNNHFMKKFIQYFGGVKKIL